MNFEVIKANYLNGLWTKVFVKMAVRKGIITADQYQEIVGEPYK